MLPIRYASLGFALVMMGAVVVPQSEAKPLPASRLDELRKEIDKYRYSALGKEIPPAELTELRVKLRNLSDRKALPTLGDVTRALLLTEWGAVTLGIEAPVSLEQVEEAVQLPDDDTFQRKVQELMSKVEARDRLSQTIVVELMEAARSRLLDRLTERCKIYLHSERVEDRIAAANLISDTLLRARRQHAGIMSTPRTEARPVVRNLRRRLRDLSPDVKQLLGNANPQVQSAGIRALSNLEIDAADFVQNVKPLLLPPSNVVLRRAAAEGVANALEVMATQWEKERSRTGPLLKSMEELMPLAVQALSDDDVAVRRASLTACNQAGLLLDELARDPLAAERRAGFNPMLEVISKSLTAINARARDPRPELRVAACHVLETLALASLRVRELEKRPSRPSPIPAPTAPRIPPSETERKNKQGVSLPARPGSRRSRLVHSDNWASDRASPAQAKTQAAPQGEPAPIVSLLPPVALPEQRSGVCPAAFVALKIDELPAPRVENPFQPTIDAMKRNLRDPDYRVRLSAVDVLETLRERAEPAIPELVRALCDSNKFVRWSSARTLGRLHPRRPDIVVRGLAGLLNDREDPSVRIAAAEALRLYGDDAKDAVPHLARVINRGDKDYILAILQTIQGIGTDAARALPNVAWLLRDRTESGQPAQPPAVRIEAAQTLGRFGPLAREHLPLLRQIMTSDPDEDVRNAASMAVLAIDRPPQQK